MTQVEVNPGWEAKYQEVLKYIPNIIGERLHPIINQMVADGLITAGEAARSKWKISLLEPVVQRMIANMIKGTLKYPTDDWPIETWMSMSLDDMADSVNYTLLTHNQIRSNRG